MNVNIDFTAETEATLLCRATAAGKGGETLIKEFVTERLAEENPPPVKPRSHVEFMANLHRAIAMHSPSNGSLDDSRESIYAGRGE